jgi:hypothetical protein
MKKIIVVMTVALALFTTSSSKAQIRFNLGVNIGSQPVWGPVGYDHVEYYYLPDIEAYYNVPKQQYVYRNGSRWIFSNRLPARYSNYDVERGYKVVMNEQRPFEHFDNDRVKYQQFRGYKEHQDVIRNSNDSKYFVVKGHPRYNENKKNGDKRDGKERHQNNDDRRDRDHN